MRLLVCEGSCAMCGARTGLFHAARTRKARELNRIHDTLFAVVAVFRAPSRKDGVPFLAGVARGFISERQTSAAALPVLFVNQKRSAAILLSTRARVVSLSALQQAMQFRGGDQGSPEATQRPDFALVK